MDSIRDDLLSLFIVPINFNVLKNTFSNPKVYLFYYYLPHRWPSKWIWPLRYFVTMLQNCRTLVSRQMEPLLRKVEYEVWKSRRATIINDCCLWAGFLDWDFYWVSIFSIFLIFPPSLSFCLPQCPFSFPLSMAKWFHLFYTMGNWSLLQTEAAFKKCAKPGKSSR